MLEPLVPWEESTMKHRHLSDSEHLRLSLSCSSLLLDKECNITAPWLAPFPTNIELSAVRDVMAVSLASILAE